MRISDWSSDVCSSDLCRKFVLLGRIERARLDQACEREHGFAVRHPVINLAITVLQVLAGQRLMNLRPEDCRTFTFGDQQMNELFLEDLDRFRLGFGGRRLSEQRRGFARCGFPQTRFGARARLADRSEEHTSELQSLMRISYA